ncbi:unnamed protein product, partial [Bubo scandiacus]
IYCSGGRPEFIKGHTDIQNFLYSVSTPPNPGPNEIDGKMSISLSRTLAENGKQIVSLHSILFFPHTLPLLTRPLPQLK